MNELVTVNADEATLAPVVEKQYTVNPDGSLTEVTTEEVFVTSEGTVAVTE